jgi:hypothetical protein
VVFTFSETKFGLNHGRQPGKETKLIEMINDGSEKFLGVGVVKIGES